MRFNFELLWYPLVVVGTLLTMPLCKRFERELVPEWRRQCVDYKVTLHETLVSALMFL